ncbi:hypothetical protein BGX27_000240 [Mortierella sp. AM989]|nr:hypothetical protein BGX27_000240 [Mortierella sp. AM989]
MHRNTFIALLICCIGFLSIAAAQSCGPQANGAVCSSPTDCCSSSGFCGSSEVYCGAGCQAGFGAACGVQGTTSAATTEAPTLTSSSLSVSSTTIDTSSSTSSSSTATSTAPTSTTTESSSSSSSSSTSTRGTFQLQPTGTPSGASASQDKGVESRLALVVVLLAGLLMI